MRAVKKTRIDCITDSPQATMWFGKHLGGVLVPGTVIAVCGRLGSGKTKLVQGIASGLGIDADEVNSPSFVLIREYGGGRLALFHADLYRLAGARDTALLGLEEYFEGNGVTAVEWPEKAHRCLPREHLRAAMSFISGQKRRIKVTAAGEKNQRVLEKLYFHLSNLRDRAGRRTARN